ncbi:hypothetical protein D3C81_327810 [compost metagenome]
MMRRTACRLRRLFRLGVPPGHGSEGSVSVFLIMVLAFVFLFSAVLIDYSRMTAASVQSERLVRAGVRSLMSAYDTELLSRYGLFAFGSSNGDELFSRTLAGSVQKSGRSDGFNLVALGYDSSSLEWGSTLGSYEVFRHQINEEMKIKAPVDFALELAGKFKGLSGAMDEASKTMNLYAGLEPLYDRREAALDKMLDLRRQAAENARSALELTMSPVSGTIPDASIGHISNAGDIVAQYGDYVRKSREDNDREPGELPSHTYEIASYLTQSANMLSRLDSALAAWRSNQYELARKAEDALAEAKSLNEEMREKIRQSVESPGSTGYSSADSWDIPASGNEAATPRIREQAEQLLMDQAEFDGMENSLQEQQRRAREAYSQASGLSGGINPGQLGLSDSSYAQKNMVTGAAGILNRYVRDYGNGGTVLDGEMAQIEQHRGSDAERKAAEREARGKLADVREIIKGLRSLNSAAGEAAEQFSELNRYYEESLAYNQSLDQNTSGRDQEDEPFQEGEAAMNMMDHLFESLGDVLLASRDRLFQTEYSAQYFPAFDITQLKGLTSGAADEIGQRVVEQLSPHNQELEYILYGLDKPGLNVAAAYSEIFTVRLAVRTTEGFVEKAGLGNPLLVVAAALLYGLTEAIKDMALLCTNGEAPLSAYIRTNLTYRDYLRLFMVLHGSGEAGLSRMLALIRLNTGINPAERSTAVSAEVRLGMRLWFLPGIMELLSSSGAVPGEMEDGLYYKTVKAHFAY